MNLSLYIESKFIVSHLQGEPLPAGSSHLWLAESPPSLPDALFEELGYFGALDEEPHEAYHAAADEPEGDYASLFAVFAEPALSVAR